MLVESQNHHQFVSKFSDSADMLSVRLPIFDFMRYFGGEISCHLPLTKQNIKLSDSFSSSVFCPTNWWASKRENKKSGIHANLPPHVSLSHSIHPCFGPDRLAQSAPAEVHSCVALNLCFHRQSYFELSFAILLPLHLSNAPQDVIPANRWREFFVWILKWKSKRINDKYRPHMQNAYFHCWHRVLAEKNLLSSC